MPLTTVPVVMKHVQSMSSLVTHMGRYGNPASGYESYMLTVHSELLNSTQRNVPKPLGKRGPPDPTVVQSHSETVYPRPIHQLSKITESVYLISFIQHKYLVCPAPEPQQARVTINPLSIMTSCGKSTSECSSLYGPTGGGTNSEDGSGGSGDGGRCGGDQGDSGDGGGDGGTVRQHTQQCVPPWMVQTHQSQMPLCPSVGTIVGTTGIAEESARARCSSSSSSSSSSKGSSSSSLVSSSSSSSLEGSSSSSPRQQDNQHDPPRGPPLDPPLDRSLPHSLRIKAVVKMGAQGRARNRRRWVLRVLAHSPIRGGATDCLEEFIVTVDEEDMTGSVTLKQSLH
ncbi:hypothetical protein Tco_0756843 [Tanacetum coccineum]